MSYKSITILVSLFILLLVATACWYYFRSPSLPLSYTNQQVIDSINLDRIAAHVNPVEEDPYLSEKAQFVADEVRTYDSVTQQNAPGNMVLDTQFAYSVTKYYEIALIDLNTISEVNGGLRRADVLAHVIDPDFTHVAIGMSHSRDRRPYIFIFLLSEGNI